MIRILLIDDEVEILRLITEYLNLKANVYEIRSYSNPEEAIKNVESFKPDLIISDLLMPQLDGCTTINRLKQKCPEAKTIIFSGIVGMFYEKEADLFISKGIAMDELAIAIDEILQKP